MNELYQCGNAFNLKFLESNLISQQFFLYLKSNQLRLLHLLNLLLLCHPTSLFHLHQSSLHPQKIPDFRSVWEEAARTTVPSRLVFQASIRTTTQTGVVLELQALKSEWKKFTISTTTSTLPTLLGASIHPLTPPNPLNLNLGLVLNNPDAARVGQQDERDQVLHLLHPS